MGYLGRDVEVTFTHNMGIVAACDSCGAIGEKELDVIKVSGELTGRFTARVALLEVLATGAEPLLATAAICNEPEPTGSVLLKGVRDEFKAAGFGALPIGISCEKNMATRQTGLGITVVGVVERNALRIGRTRDRDHLFCLGRPKVGSEVRDADDSEIVQARDILQLVKDPAVHDIIPVGSQGISGEINQLEAAIKLSFLPEAQQLLDLNKSGGPSTCLIFSAGQGFMPDRRLAWGESGKSSAPISYLGKFCG